MHAFDAYGTIFDVRSATSGHIDVLGQNATHLAAFWRTKQLEYTWVLNSIGSYEPFDILTARALDFSLNMLGFGAAHSLREELLNAYLNLTVFPDVCPAFARLKSRGDEILIFSNANLRMLEMSLSTFEVRHMIDHVISIEPAMIFKPNPRAYALLRPWQQRSGSLTFYSSNRWDIAGACSFGLNSKWINRESFPEEYAAFRPASEARTLLEAIV